MALVFQNFSRNNSISSIFILMLVASAFSANAQNPRNNWYAGVGVSPVYLKLPGTGLGVTIGYEHFFNAHFSLAPTMSYIHFSGQSINYYLKDTISNIQFIPVLVKLRYYFNKTIYMGAGAGLQKVFDKNRGVQGLLSPDIGFKIPVRRNFIDLGATWMVVPGSPSFSENNYLNKGGFNYLICRLGIEL